MIIMNVSHVVRAAVVTVLGTVLPTTMTACGGSSGGGDGRPNVVVGAYPFEYAVQRVGGDLVKLTNLLAPGTDGHDHRRSEERRVGKECRSRWSPYH